ncbi:GNAT family acetyltransferase [Kushneria sinocarnis]|uniref:GNAT family acetyltransferase n=1 Tax=Kushneria sinocarnis TaxID=595502 RepID=A0A420WZK4_9GAMM|nr:GNAT family N-acetyltransferase [Kushneria sinocarnis]RKR06655.1 GNAT family acetyltransferase [Kushneria sinocarnis]
MLDRLRLREARAEDAADQAEVFYHAVMQGAAGHYSREQREAWVQALPREAAAWVVRHLHHRTVVADLDRRCVGFCELGLGMPRQAAAIVTLYVWPSLAGRGIGSRLLAVALDQAREAGAAMIMLDASVMLAPWLCANGWEHLGSDVVERAGVSLPRERFRYRLSDHDGVMHAKAAPGQPQFPASDEKR